MYAPEANQDFLNFFGRFWGTAEPAKRRTMCGNKGLSSPRGVNLSLITLHFVEDVSSSHIAYWPWWQKTYGTHMEHKHYSAFLRISQANTIVKSSGPIMLTSDS